MKWSFVTLLAFASLGSAATAQTTWHVDDDGVAPGNGTLADPYTSIQYALEQPSTVDGDTILVAPGTYGEAVNVLKRVHVVSAAGPLETRLFEASGQAGVFMGAPGAVFEGFSLLGPSSQMVWQFSGRVVGCILDGRGLSGLGVNMSGGSLVNCTLSGFAVGIRGDLNFDSSLHLYGCVVWGNGQDIDDSTFVLSRVVQYCAGLDGDPAWLNHGPGNLLGDPGLWASEYGDLRLRPGSPCIDAGLPNAPRDPDGSRADIGALTYDPAWAHGPEVYCEAKPASGGCLPAMSATGTASVSSPDPFVLHASEIVPNQFGLLIWSRSAAALPFQGGVLCVAAPIERTPIQHSGSSGVACGGTYSFDFNAYLRGGGPPALVPGDLVFAQYWFRDPLDVTGFGTGLTDAIRFGIGL